MAIIFYIKTAEAREEWYYLLFGSNHDVNNNRFELRDSDICSNTTNDRLSFKSNNNDSNSNRSTIVNRISSIYGRGSLNAALVINEIEVSSSISPMTKDIP